MGEDEIIKPVARINEEARAANRLLLMKRSPGVKDCDCAEGPPVSEDSGGVLKNDGRILEGAQTILLNRRRRESRKMTGRRRRHVVGSTPV